MELGKHITAELKLNDRGDWLRHWLAHHVAELVRDAQTAKDVTARREAAKRATETILKIWDHRETLPGDVNPLARYREALQALNELRSPPRQQFLIDDLSRLSVVGTLYSRLPKLIEALVLLPVVRAGSPDRATSQAVRKFLGKDERSLLSMFQLRVKLVGQKGDVPNAPAAAPPKDDYKRFEEAAHRLIDNTVADLKSIRDGKTDGRQPRRRARH